MPDQLDMELGDEAGNRRHTKAPQQRTIPDKEGLAIRSSPRLETEHLLTFAVGARRGAHLQILYLKIPL